MDHGGPARLTRNARGMGVSNRRNPIPTYPATSLRRNSTGPVVLSMAGTGHLPQGTV